MPLGPFRVVETPDMPIVLPDGTRLSARMWIPEGSGRKPVPAILEYLPYRKRDGTCARDMQTHPYFASHGYACIRVDLRGTGDSEGVMTDEYTPQELADGVEVINWISAQYWCSGQVGIMGISWGGFNGLQLAALQPEPLKAVITLCSTADRFADDIHFKGGCLLNENLGWGATMLAYSSLAPDRAVVGAKWRDMWRERLEVNPFLAAHWLRHQHRDAYWRHGSVCEDFSAIQTPVLAIGGWGDGYKNTVQNLLENLSVPAKGIIGPWIHKYPHIATPEPRIGFLQEALRWWDRWLKGMDTGVEHDPDLRLYLMQSEPPQQSYTTRKGRWVAQDFRNAPRQTLHLGAGVLADQPEPFSLPIDSPADTGRDSGEYCAIWQGPDLPGDQTRDDAQSLCFDSAPLTEPLAIVGAPEITLTLSSTAPVAQIAVRLNDVHPDGQVSRITYGVLNLTHRQSAAQPEPMPVETPVTIRLMLDQIAYELPAGHRLRLSVSNACWPLVWPAPTATCLTLVGGQVALPLLAETGEQVAFLPPETAPEWDAVTLRTASNHRETRHDPETGLTTLEIRDDFGAVEDGDHGLVTDTIAREWWQIHPEDPLSARGKTHWSTVLRRENWCLRTESFCNMHSDRENFYLSARVEAYESDKLVFSKDYKEVIARDCL